MWCLCYREVSRFPKGDIRKRGSRRRGGWGGGVERVGSKTHHWHMCQLSLHLNQEVSFTGLGVHLGAWHQRGGT